MSGHSNVTTPKRTRPGNISPVHSRQVPSRRATATGKRALMSACPTEVIYCLRGDGRCPRRVSFPGNGGLHPLLVLAARGASVRRRTPRPRAVTHERRGVGSVCQETALHSWPANGSPGHIGPQTSALGRTFGELLCRKLVVFKENV